MVRPTRTQPLLSTRLALDSGAVLIGPRRALWARAEEPRGALLLALDRGTLRGPLQFTNHDVNSSKPSCYWIRVFSLIRTWVLACLTTLCGRYGMAAAQGFDLARR